MLRGALVYIDRDKNGDRLIEEAIQKGLRLFERHNGKAPALDLVALVNPRTFTEEKLQDKQFSLAVEWHARVPYAHLWVCRVKELDMEE